MILEYIKGNPTTIYDTNRGLYQTEYHENLETMIKKENEIEILQNQIDEYQKEIIEKKDSASTQYLYSRIIITLFTLTFLCICAFPILYAYKNELVPNPTISYKVATLVGFSIIAKLWYTDRKIYKKAMLQVEAMKTALNNCIEELKKKQNELSLMKHESKEPETNIEKVNMTSQIDTYRQTLENKLNELIEQKQNEKQYSLKLSPKKNL